MRNGIVVAGALILDRHYAAPTYPEEGRLVGISGVHEDIGGAGNLIIDLAKLDTALTVRVSAVLGKGSSGKAVMKELCRYSNIETKGIVKYGHTPVTIVIDADDTHQRTFFYYPGAGDYYDEPYINWNVLQGGIFQLEYLLLMKGLDADDVEYGTHAARILSDAQKHGMKTSIDMVSKNGPRVQKIVHASLKYTDICTINELEAQEASGITLTDRGVLIEKNMRPALEKLAEYGVSTWVIIHASSCSFGLECRTGTCYKVPNIPLPDGYIKGKTGAGDAYCAGVLYAAYREMSIINAMKLGTACASCSLSEINGTDGMRSYTETCALYDRYKGGIEYEKI
ncbi:MAG: carbohydrate kinase family protein [Treponema sp.]